MKCNECGKTGRAITVLTGNEGSWDREDFTCYGCWKEKSGSPRERPSSEDLPIGWLRG